MPDFIWTLAAYIGFYQIGTWIGDAIGVWVSRRSTSAPRKGSPI